MYGNWMSCVWGPQHDEVCVHGICTGSEERHWLQHRLWCAGIVFLPMVGISPCMQATKVSNLRCSRTSFNPCRQKGLSRCLTIYVSCFTRVILCMFSNGVGNGYKKPKTLCADTTILQRDGSAVEINGYLIESIVRLLFTNRKIRRNSINCWLLCPHVLLLTWPLNCSWNKVDVLRIACEAQKSEAESHSKVHASLCWWALFQIRSVIFPPRKRYTNIHSTRKVRPVWKDGWGERAWRLLGEWVT